MAAAGVVDTHPLEEHMSTETARTIPIVVRVPSELDLTRQQAAALEDKWQADLMEAAGAGSQGKIKWHIEIKIKIGNE